MRQLFVVDLKDYEEGWVHSKRPSARGIILSKDGKIALVYSTRDRYYKFPGGGIQEDENPMDALIREVLEEVGLVVIKDSIQEFGSVLRLQKSDVKENTVFEQENLYYICDVELRMEKQSLDAYEAEAGFELRYVTIDEAIAVNASCVCDNLYDQVIVDREKHVFEIIKEELLQKQN